MKKQAFSVVLAIILCTGVIPYPVFGEDGFPSAWADAQVREAILAGLVPSALQSQYTQPITRAEFCLLAVNIYEGATGKEITARKSFVDTNDINVQKMGGLGLVNGIRGDIFSPCSSLTREQAAVILSNLAAASGFSLPDADTSFADADMISSWARKAVGQMQASSMMNGDTGNRFNPQSTYTREQSIVTMLRLYDTICKTKLAGSGGNPELTERSVYTTIMAHESRYPEGTAWTNENSYTWKGGIFRTGYACAAFAFMLSDGAFGDLPARKHTNIDDIKVGDVLRVDQDTHSVILLSRDAQKITLAEGNYNGTVHWGRELTWDELKATFDYALTRYPES